MKLYPLMILKMFLIQMFLLIKLCNFQKIKNINIYFFLYLTFTTFLMVETLIYQFKLILFLLVCYFYFVLKIKITTLHLKNFYKNNQKSILFYLLFISYLIFQIFLLPIEILKFFSPEKFKYIK